MSLILDGSAGVTFPNSTVQASAGQVLQVVQTVYNTTTTISSTTPTTVISATITPKFSTSKILVMFNGMVGVAANNAGSLNAVIGQMLRGSTSIFYTDRFVAIYAGSTTPYLGANASLSYLDSPATTSATTYKVQYASNLNSATVYVQVNNATSTITLMEIAA